MPHNLPVTPVLRITALNNCLSVAFRHPYNFRGEFHPFWEMVYAMEDLFQVAGNDKVYAMKKGDIIFHKPMEFHRLWSVEQRDVHAFIVGFCAEGPMLAQLEGGAFELNETQQAQLEGLQHFVAQQFPSKKGALEDHLQAMIRERNTQSAQLQSFVDQFQLFLLSLSQNPEPLTVKEIADSEDSRLYQATVQLLTEHVDRWITTQQVAQTLHYSQSRIKRTFAKFSDIGIHKYLLKLKSAEAIRLLRQGKSCGEVSRALGFGNQNYFSTVFKRETGFPPSHYSDIP